MSEELEALGRRAVALGLEWVPGMVDHHGRRVLCVETDGEGFAWVRYAGEECGGWVGLDLWARGVYDAATAPDLSDRATLGCLEGLVCDAWRDPDAHLMRLTGLQTFGNWRMVGNPPAGVLGRMSPDGYPTRAEALVAALEAASGVAP